MGRLQKIENRVYKRVLKKQLFTVAYWLRVAKEEQSVDCHEAGERRRRVKINIVDVLEV